MPYLVCHMEKYKRQEVSPVEKENERDGSFEASNPQIDSSRTSQNYHIVSPHGSYIDIINGRIATLLLRRKIRSDAVYMNSFVLGSDNQFFNSLPPWHHREFFEDCVRFFADKFGKENIISAVVHLDETTPHMHLNLVPIADGKLCSKDLYDKKKLSILQTEFWETVGKKYGLQRGQEGSSAKHLDTAQFKASKIIKNAEGYAKKVKEQNDAFEKAMQGEFAKSKSGLKEQIAAATVKNEDLMKRLDKSMSEALEYGQKNQRLEEQNERYYKAVQLLAKLQRDNPTEYERLTASPPTSFRSNTNSNSK